MLIGVKEQCDLYPSIQSLLADESGIIVQMEEIADAIAPAIKINRIINFINTLTIFLIVITINIIYLLFKR